MDIVHDGTMPKLMEPILAVKLHGVDAIEIDDVNFDFMHLLCI